MKTYIITSTLVLAPLLASGASITTLSTTDFFSSDHVNKREGTPTQILPLARVGYDENVLGIDLGALNIIPGIDINSTTRLDNTFAAGTTSWNHVTGGFVHASVAGVITNLADAQIRSTSTVSTAGGGSLTFGREITLDGVGTSLGTVLAPLAGASVLQSWNSTATVTADLAAATTYQITFDVSADSGLPVDLLNSTEFSIAGTGVGGGSTTLNLLGLLSLGFNPGDTGTATYEFTTTDAMSSIDFGFAGEALADISLLGGAAANSNFMTFSGFSVSEVPEPTGAALLAFAGLLGLLRRRR